VNKTADVKARLHFKGLLGIATGILSHLLEMEGEGPIDNMRWRMSKMPRLWGRKKMVPGQPVPPVNPPPPAARPPRKRIR